MQAQRLSHDRPAACLQLRCRALLSGCVLALLLLSNQLALGQGYTYTAGQNLGLFEGRQLKTGESLYIPAGVSAYSIIQVVGTGVRIVNDGTWYPSQATLEYGAVLTNNGTLKATFLRVTNGVFINRGRATLKELPLEAASTVQNRSGALLTITNELSVRGTLVNCGGLVVERYVLYPGGVEAVCEADAPAPPLPPPPSPSLPVVLVAFTGRSVAQGVLLEWQIASELNASHYEVERSADGQAWAEVGRVAARGLATYRYTDKPSPSLVYYRLRSVDTDGQAAYSPVVAIAGAALVRRSYYNEIGQRLAGPIQGFYLEVAEYENGAVERKKYVGL
jgi:hypothetical protein